MTMETQGRELKSWLGEGGENLFQKIKRVCVEAEAAGVKLYRLSIGQPSGPALPSARWACAKAVVKEDKRWHEYQDNGYMPYSNWAQRFAQAHLKSDLAEKGERIAYMPIPGIKPMLGLIQLACGLSRKGRRSLNVGAMTNPGYPVPDTWARYLRVGYFPFVTDLNNVFRPDLENEEDLAGYLDLAMLNFPHNPSGQIATQEYWQEVCAFCEKKGIRLFNDGAYLALAHDESCCALADVAPGFPGLSWIEAYSASKSIWNGTGWRVGAVAGSPDFIADLGRIKGNTDSGFFAPAAHGALIALEEDKEGVEKVRQKYQERINLLVSILKSCGMQMAVLPRAGFFTLWLAPKFAFGRQIKDAEHFNNEMIQRTGIVGVPFGPYIRYAVTSPIENWMSPIMEAFSTAHVSY